MGKNGRVNGDLPFNWMIHSAIDLAPGFYNRHNLRRLIPTDGVDFENHDVFRLNIAHLQNREEQGQLLQSTMISRTCCLLDHYNF